MPPMLPVMPVGRSGTPGIPRLRAPLGRGNSNRKPSALRHAPTPVPAAAAGDTTLPQPNVARVPKRRLARHRSESSIAVVTTLDMSCAICSDVCAVPVRASEACTHIFCRACLARHCWSHQYGDYRKLQELRARAIQARRADGVDARRSNRTVASPSALASCGGRSPRGGGLATAFLGDPTRAMLEAPGCPLCRAPVTLGAHNAKDAGTLSADDRRMLSAMQGPDPRRLACDVLLRGSPDDHFAMRLAVHVAPATLSGAREASRQHEMRLLQVVASGVAPEAAQGLLDAGGGGCDGGIGMKRKGNVMVRDAPSLVLPRSRRDAAQAAAASDSEDDADAWCRGVPSIKELVARRRGQGRRR